MVANAPENRRHLGGFDAKGEPATIYRLSGSDMVQTDFADYVMAARVFREAVADDPAWCELWEITGMSAMGPLCAYKRER